MYAVARHKAESLAPPRLLGLDHAAVGVRDLVQSLKWYHGVLGMEHVLADDPMFNGDIAMAGVRGAPLVALLRLPENESPLAGSREQRGHFALRISNEDFTKLRGQLPTMLRTHRAHDRQSLWIEEQDYGRQLSLFFEDPDGNEVEVTTWLRPP